MDIAKLDKNFEIKKTVDSNGEATYEIPSPLFSLHGLSYDESLHSFARMDMKVAERVNDRVHAVARHTAGGRLCFRTDSKSLKISVTYPRLWVMSHMAITGSCGFTLFEERADGERFVANLMPDVSDEKGYTAATKLGGEEMRQYVLYFPLYQEINSLSVTLDESARVEPANPYRDVLPILYYGSSITQGGCASRPDSAYQSLICKRNGIDFINLGFSGNAKGETEMVDYLASIDCSLFVCDYDHNAPTIEHLEATHYALYERYRAQRPTTPILFLSKPDFRGAENCIRRRDIIRATYRKAKKQGDNNVYFLDGASYYAKKNYWDFAVDGCHPTDYGFVTMADKIYKKMCKIDDVFKGE